MHGCLAALPAGLGAGSRRGRRAPPLHGVAVLSKQRAEGGGRPAVGGRLPQSGEDAVDVCGDVVAGTHATGNAPPARGVTALHYGRRSFGGGVLHYAAGMRIPLSDSHSTCTQCLALQTRHRWLFGYFLDRSGAPHSVQARAAGEGAGAAFSGMVSRSGAADTFCARAREAAYPSRQIAGRTPQSCERRSNRASTAYHLGDGVCGATDVQLPEAAAAEWHIACV